MKRYKFSLDPVRRVRQIEQDAAQAELLAAQQQLAEAEAGRARAADHYDAQAGTPAPATAGEWLAQRCRADSAAMAVWAADAACTSARDGVDGRLVDLRDARMRTNALERLDERRREEHRLAALREEDAAVDELVTARHGRQR